MDLIERAQQIIYEHLDILSTHQEEIVEALEKATNTIVEALLQDGKVFTCANGPASSLARILTLCLIDQFERERPGLPSINLDTDSQLLSEMSRENRMSDGYAKPVRTLASANDILVVFSVDGNCNNLFQAVQAAHDKDMKVIAFIGSSTSNLASIIMPEDTIVPLLSDQRGKYLQSGMIATTALLDLIDCTLFGPPH